MTRISAIVFSAVLVFAPAAATAQGTSYGSIGVAISQGYDYNLFAASLEEGSQESDFVTRIGPIAEAGYESERFTIIGRYEMAAERFWQHRVLDRRIGHQDAALQLRSRPTRQLELGATGSFVDTYSPLELGTPDAVVLGREHAQRLSVRPTLAYAWSRTGTVAFEYEFARESLADQGAALVHMPEMRVAISPNVRTTYGAIYRARRFGVPGAPPELSHVVALDVRRNLTRLTDVRLTAGPRLFGDVVRPEVIVDLRRRVRQAELSIGYAETQTSVLGQRGIVEVRRIRAAATLPVGRNVTVTAAPTIFRNQRDDLSATIRAVDLETVARFSPTTSLVISGQIGRHDGDFGGTYERVPYYSLGTTLRIAFSGARRPVDRPEEER